MKDDSEEQIRRFYTVLVANKDRIPSEVGLALADAFHAVVESVTRLAIELQRNQP